MRPTKSNALNRSQDDTGTDFGIESALALTGFRQFQWLMLAVSGLVYLSYGYDNGVNGYISAAAQCDLKMTSSEKGILNAAYHIGGISSAFLWGVLADHFGRKRIIVSCLVVEALVTIASFFSQSFIVFGSFRFLNGAVMMGPGSLICTYLNEFIGVNNRSMCVVVLGVFYTASWIALPSIALVVLPLELKLELLGFVFSSWRLMIMVQFLLVIMSAFILGVFFPESPKFLYSQGNDIQAIEVLENMYRFNYGSSKGQFPVRNIVPTCGGGERRSIVTPVDIPQMPSKLRRACQAIITVYRQILQLFKAPYLSSTILTTSLMFCNAFGYHGLGLWLPEIYTRFQDHYKESMMPVTMCELTHYTNQTLNNSNEPDDLYCANTRTNPGAYFNTLIMGCTCLIGNVLITLLTNSLGLKRLTVIAMGISAGSIFATYFVRTSLENLIVSSIFLTFMEASCMTIITVTCEMYPTNIRALAGCIVLLSNRIAAMLSNFILGYFIDTICELPLFLIFAIVMLGTLLGFLLPSEFSKNWPTD